MRYTKEEIVNAVFNALEYVEIEKINQVLKENNNNEKKNDNDNKQNDNNNNGANNTMSVPVQQNPKRKGGKSGKDSEGPTGDF